MKMFEYFVGSNCMGIEANPFGKVWEKTKQHANGEYWLITRIVYNGNKAIEQEYTKSGVFLNKK